MERRVPKGNLMGKGEGYIYLRKYHAEKYGSRKDQGGASSGQAINSATDLLIE